MGSPKGCLLGLRVRDSGPFGALLRAISDELIDARIHFNLYQDLVASGPEYADEFNESNTPRVPEPRSGAGTAYALTRTPAAINRGPGLLQQRHDFLRER
jgi:hypothetical protein